MSEIEYLEEKIKENNKKIGQEVKAKIENKRTHEKMKKLQKR